MVSPQARHRFDVISARSLATSTPSSVDATVLSILSQNPAEQLSWEADASAWTIAVLTGTIADRQLATDQAVLSAVVQRAPRRALDLGCGEGCLPRTLAQRGIEVIGCARGRVPHVGATCGCAAEPGSRNARANASATRADNAAEARTSAG